MPSCVTESPRTRSDHERDSRRAARTHSCPFAPIRNSHLGRRDLVPAATDFFQDLAPAATVPLPSPRGPNAGCGQILVNTTSWERKIPGHCQILETATSWKRQHPGKGHVLETATGTSWKRKHPRKVHVLDNATSWRGTNPGKYHILEKAQSWKLPNQGKEQILESATSWKMPHPGNAKCRERTNPGEYHILENGSLPSARGANAGYCHILGQNISWGWLRPEGCHILENVTSWGMSHPG